MGFPAHYSAKFWHLDAGFDIEETGWLHVHLDCIRSSMEVCRLKFHVRKPDALADVFQNSVLASTVV